MRDELTIAFVAEHSPADQSAGLSRRLMRASDGRSSGRQSESRRRSGRRAKTASAPGVLMMRFRHAR